MRMFDKVNALLTLLMSIVTALIWYIAFDAMFSIYYASPEEDTSHKWVGMLFALGFAIYTTWRTKQYVLEDLEEYKQYRDERKR